MSSRSSSCGRFSSRGDLRWLLALAALVILASPVASQARGGGRPPNVLLIVSDDQGWGDIRSHGNQKIDTPVLDRLAAEGARFDEFFVSPVCAPTRASLMTGRYHLRTGTAGVSRGMETMRAEEVTIAEIMGAAGYATGLFGKWHLGQSYPFTPRAQGFQEFLGFTTGHWEDYFDPKLEHDGEVIHTRGYITDVLTDGALNFIRRHRDRPFFAYVPYNAPHAPNQLPDAYYDKYVGRGLDPVTAAIYGMVDNLDGNIGRLLAELDALGLRENTIVLFMSDNGPHTDRYNAGLRGRKGSVYEGGVRAPLFIRWPDRIRPGSRVDRIAGAIDLLPTLVELTGVRRARTLPLDGRSLVPLLSGSAVDWPERTLFSHQNRGSGRPSMFPGSARTERYRLVRNADAWELHDMIQDPEEKTDIAATHPAVVERLAAAYEGWFREVSRKGNVPPPIQVGHVEAPVVAFPASEATFTGKIEYANQGTAHDWLTNLAGPGDEVSWDVQVVRPGRYEASLLYTAPPAGVGSRVRVEAGGATVTAPISRAVAHLPVARPDRDPKAGRFVKEFATMPVGILRLERGRTRLRVRPERQAVEGILDVERVILRRIGD